MRPSRPVRGSQSRRRAASPIKAQTESLTLEIERLGTDGAGLARRGEKIIAVPGALPGETIRAEVQSGRTLSVLTEIITASPDRATPACPHFMRCGGCVAQHMSVELYRGFKRRRVADALARVGLTDVRIEPTRESPPGSRRRATFEVLPLASGVRLGFHEMGSHQIVDLQSCPVLRPEIVAILPEFRTLLAALVPVGKRASLSLTMTPSGLDAGLRIPAAPGLAQLERLAAFAAEHDLARLWVAEGDAPPDPVAARRAPLARPGGVPVELPMGGFLQATEEGEQALIGLVCDALAGAASIVDLFSGIGTFSLPLGAAGAAIHAVEADAVALVALERAAHRHNLGGAVTIERRDLEARPLEPHELARYDAVIFDPPRSGAKPQAEAIAASAIRTAVAVSCDPATFARDAAILVGGGFILQAVTPVDQFLWSSHIELMGVFRRR